MIARYFTAEQRAIDAIEAEIAALDQQLEEQVEEHGDEEGLLSEVVEGAGEKRNIIEKAVNTRLREIKGDPDFADERRALDSYKALVDQQKEAKARLKTGKAELEQKLEAKYAAIDEVATKGLVIEDKWLARLSADVRGEVDRTAQTLTARLRQLAERYATPLPKLVEEVDTLSARVEVHLKKMGAVWT